VYKLVASQEGLRTMGLARKLHGTRRDLVQLRQFNGLSYTWLEGYTIVGREGRCSPPYMGLLSVTSV
jgi:hypothetical protein